MRLGLKFKLTGVIELTVGGVGVAVMDWLKVLVVLVMDMVRLFWLMDDWLLKLKSSDPLWVN